MPGTEAITTPPPGDITQVVEHLFRHEAAKMVSALTRIFGFENLSLAEDVVQEALLRALKTWPFYGVPQNPAAWIMQVSKNLAMDVVRREKTFRDKEADIGALKVSADSAGETEVHLAREFTDDRLRMMFVCCHPVVPSEAQIALALKTLCGFSVGEIARAFLTNEAAVAKRLTRAKQKIREARIPFEIPGAAELEDRLDTVLQTLYLLFNEGYKASIGDTLVREELCKEAIRMVSLLVEHPSGNQPRTHALLALMLFGTARLPSRTDADGNLLRLKEQDRTLWDASVIARGMYHLAMSASGNDLSVYHLEAAIAAAHCSALTYESTDWNHIVALYDMLTHLDDSVIVALNRAIAVAQMQGARSGLDALASIGNQEKLNAYYLYHAAKAEFEMQLQQTDSAAKHLRKALELTQIHSEQIFLRSRLRLCEPHVCA
ncbi:MAG: RNA polymerase sigma factor [Candidatus Sumerlaeaceae bacterium]